MRWALGPATSPEYGSMRNIGLAAATLLIILIHRFLGGFFNRVAILFGLVLGTVVDIPFCARTSAAWGTPPPSS
jgi:xanthine/uracil permease